MATNLMGKKLLPPCPRARNLLAALMLLLLGLPLTAAAIDTPTANTTAPAANQGICTLSGRHLRSITQPGVCIIAGRKQAVK